MRPSHRSRIAGKTAAVCLAVVMSMPGGFAHEIDTDRLTLVLREPRHITLTFRVDEVALLGRIAAPDASPVAVMMSMAAMNDKDFVNIVEKTRAKFSSQVFLTDENSKTINLSNWRWKPIEQLRAEIRELAMTTVVGGDSHLHQKSSEINADAISDSVFGRVTVHLPVESKSILVITYRPTQKHFDASKGSGLVVDF